MVRSGLALGLVLVIGSWACGAIIYEPVQDQYRDHHYDRGVFYYGGHDPIVLHTAREIQERYSRSVDPARDILPSFVTEGRFGYNLMHRGLITSPPAFTYVDLLPAGMNAYPYGYSEVDVQNLAAMNVPRYFTKRQLLASAHREGDGNLVVPAQAPLHHGMIQIKPMQPTTQPSTTRPQTEPILIIPKRLLNKPLWEKSQPVANAQ